MKLAIVLVFALLLLVFTTQPAESQNGRTARGWDQEAAARYLDERMEIWFAKAKKLQSGKIETSCVSCHTTVPYVLARPALRRAMHMSNATPQEARLVEETTRRVESYSAHQ